MKQAGMYSVFENMEGNVVIGKFTLCKQCDGQIWIQKSYDEGGAFCENQLEKVIQDFFNKKF